MYNIYIYIYIFNFSVNLNIYIYIYCTKMQSNVTIYCKCKNIKCKQENNSLFRSSCKQIINTSDLNYMCVGMVGHIISVCFTSPSKYITTSLLIYSYRSIDQLVSCCLCLSIDLSRLIYGFIFFNGISIFMGYLKPSLNKNSKTIAVK